MVGKTYAELIFAFLKDLRSQSAAQEKIYILEMGAGHGRLAYHILKHLERLVSHSNHKLPDYCYILSDIVEANIDFFDQHPQLQQYYEKGHLDVAFFDVAETQRIVLRHSKVVLHKGSLKQPIIAIANYLFDSIPTDLYYFKNTKTASCSVTVEIDADAEETKEEDLLNEINLVFRHEILEKPPYEEDLFNELLEEYSKLIYNNYLFFPHIGMRCLQMLSCLSEKGLMLLTMDKGFHQIEDIQNAGHPEIIKHGSFSIWVNYHSLKVFCEKQKGLALFPTFSTFYAEVGCLLFLPDAFKYIETMAAYQRFVNDFGPDDYNGIKRLAFKHFTEMNLSELIAILRLSAYDSSMFIKALPRFKQLSRHVTFSQRNRIAQTMDQTWNYYFSINESFDLAYEIGGVFYDLGFYPEALKYFGFSVSLFGNKPDVYYNTALCYYQLRKDELFLKTIQDGQLAFPNFERLDELKKLDLKA